MPQNPSPKMGQMVLCSFHRSHRKSAFEIDHFLRRNFWMISGSCNLGRAGRYWVFCFPKNSLNACFLASPMVAVCSGELGRSLLAGTRCRSSPCAPGSVCVLLGTSLEANANHLVRPSARPVIVTDWPIFGNRIELINSMESKANDKFKKRLPHPQTLALDDGLVAHPAGARLLEEGWNGYHWAM